MERSNWFSIHLKSSAEGFAWAIERVPAARWYDPPPGPLGEWTAARHLFHLHYYEEHLALPGMQQWLGAPLPPEGAWQDDDDAWAAVTDKSPQGLLASFQKVRQEQIDLLEALSGADWQTPRETLWGARPLAWVVTKTFRHTYEHGDTLMRMALWWEHILQEIAKAQAAST